MPITIPTGYQGHISPEEALRSPQAFLVYHQMVSTEDLTEDQVNVLQTLVNTWKKDNADLVTKRVRLEQNLSRLSRAIAPIWLTFKMMPGATLEKLVISMTDMVAKDLGIMEAFLPTTDDLIRAVQKILQASSDTK